MKKIYLISLAIGFFLIFISFNVVSQEICEGCFYNNNCYEVGEELTVEGVLSYCSIDKQILQQKQDNEICDNDFECINNLCSNGKCVNLYKEVKEKEGLIEEVSKFITELMKPITASVKNMSKYSDKEVFLISDKNWKDVLPLVPLTTWTGDENCQKGYGTPNNVCAYPTLIYHEEDTGFDTDSIIYFMQQYAPEKVTIIGGTPQELDNLLIVEPELGAGLQENQIQKINVENFLFYWQEFKDIVYVEDNYELALLASTYASLINAPLIIQGTSLDQDILFSNRNIICVGNVNKNCDEQYNLEQLQQKYIEKTNTDKIILTNPSDLNYISEGILNFDNPNEDSFYKSSGTVKIHSGFSLTAPILASGKHELIITTTQNEVKDVDSDLDMQINNLNFDPAYLTIIENPYTIKMDYDFCPSPAFDFTRGHCKGPADNYFYADIDEDYYEELAIGRIFGDTISDVSAYIARDLFLGEIFILDKDISLLNNPGGDLTFFDTYLDMINSNYGLNSNIYEIENYTKENLYVALQTSSLLISVSHGSSSGIQATDYTNNDLPWMNPLISYVYACLTCKPYDGFRYDAWTPYCGKFIRKGAVGYIGSIEIFSQSEDGSGYPWKFFVKSFWDAFLLDGYDIGNAMKYARNTYSHVKDLNFLSSFEGNIIGEGRWMLVGDPTIRLPYLLPINKINTQIIEEGINPAILKDRIVATFPPKYDIYYPGKEQFSRTTLTEKIRWEEYYNPFETYWLIYGLGREVIDDLGYKRIYLIDTYSIPNFYDGNINIFKIGAIKSCSDLNENDFCPITFSGQQTGLGTCQNGLCVPLVTVMTKTQNILILEPWECKDCVINITNNLQSIIGGKDYDDQPNLYSDKYLGYFSDNILPGETKSKIITKCGRINEVDCLEITKVYIKSIPGLNNDQYFILGGENV